MTVEQLITLLQGCNPKAEVVYRNDSSISDAAVNTAAWIHKGYIDPCGDWNNIGNGRHDKPAVQIR